jgi:hypothetical protein
MRPRQIALEENNIQLSFEPNEIPVKKGEVIAKSGNTGSSGGPHVHFELRDCNDANDEFYNPMPFFRDQISDRKAPRASHIYIYPLGGLVCGQNARQTATIITAQSGQRTVNRNLTAWGRVGLGLKAFCGRQVPFFRASIHQFSDRLSCVDDPTVDDSEKLHRARQPSEHD